MNKVTIEEIIKVAENIDSSYFGDKDIKIIVKHLIEEVDELEEALDLQYRDQWNVESKFDYIKEFGDVLFCLVSLARHTGVDIKQALSLTVCKLQERKKFKIGDADGTKEGYKEDK